MVTGPKGPATVDVTPSTQVTQFTAAQLTDIVAGECVAVHPTRGNWHPRPRSPPRPSW